MAGHLLPTLMVLIGLLILFNPAQRLFYSILGVLLSLGTWPTSNLGAFSSACSSGWWAAA